MKHLTLFLLLISPIQASEVLKIRELKTTEFKKISEYVKTDLVAVIAFGNYCPILRRHVPALNELADKYQGKVTFILLNSIRDISDTELETERKNFQLTSLIYQDENLSTVKALGLSTLSEVALLKISTGEVLYKGAINNQFTFDVMRQKPTINYLTDAITSAVKNEKIKTKQSKVFGCVISF